MSLKSTPRWILVPIILVGTLTFLTSPVQAKVYKYCELAHLMHEKHGVARAELGDWMCAVEWASSFKTEYKYKNWDGSTNWGLFQISELHWCDPDNGRKSANKCQVKCSKFLGDDQDDAIKCAIQIYKEEGFNAWYGWKRHCRGKGLSAEKPCFQNNGR